MDAEPGDAGVTALIERPMSSGKAKKVQTSTTSSGIARIVST